MRAKQRCITSQQYIELDAWLVTNIAACKDKHHAAELASVVLGVPVSDASITRVCNHRKLDMPRKHYAKKVTPVPSQVSMLVIDADMDELRAAVATLSRFFNPPGEQRA